jgi:serine/threonine-protein kinase
MVLGTPHYMSAEQAKGMPADQRSDIYALGVILYEMLVGKVPFDDKSIPSILVKHLTEPPRPPSSLRGDIPKEVETLVLRCLEKDPDRRFQSADELGRALALREETVPHRALDPTLATMPLNDQVTVPSDPGLTGAGGASATAKPVPFPPPVPPSEPTGRTESGGTLRAREVPTAPPRPAPARPQGGSRTGLFLGLAVIGFLLLVMAGGGFLLLRLLRGGSPQETTEVATASTGAMEVPATPSEEPPGSEAPPPTETEPPGDAPLVTEAVSEEPSRQEEPPPPPSARTAQEESRAGRTQPPPPRATSSVPAQPAPSAEESIPENPTVSVECEGVRDACGEIRTALQQALERKGMRSGRAPASDIHVLVAAEEIEARTEEQFGNTFVIRTYSVTLDAEAPRFGDSITFPPRTFSFDARLGREKLRGEAHVIAASAAERIEKYWETKR